MSIHRTYDKHDCLSARPDTPRHPYRTVRHLSRVDTESRLRATWIGKVSFIEDFTLEHSIHGLRVTSIEVTSLF